VSDDNQSEFICHVVKVVRTEPHPNADRLELVTISLDGKEEFPDKIINSKGDLQPGELVVYVGPDSIVPLEGGVDGTPSPFAFLKERLDAKGKTHYRIRSARIRGVYSPGLLIRLPMVVLNLGTSMAAHLGVTNWESDRGLTKSGTTSSVPSVRAKDIYPVYTVYSLRKCPSIFREGELISVTEKIHGTNFRFGYGGRRRFYYGTHRTNLSDNRGLFARLRDFILGRGRVNTNPGGYNNPWKQCVVDYALEKECRDAKNYIFYAEIFGPGIQKGWDYGLKKPEFRVFDVYDASDNTWLNSVERQAVAFSCGFRLVPKLGNLYYDLSAIKQFAENDSRFGGVSEGVVVESRETGKKAKWVSERYRLSKES
jgi:RNA ligase (TIGR02306 family)